MKKILLVTGFFLGLFSLSLFLIYVFAGVLYVFSDVSHPGPGDIVYTPKWIFLFSPLFFLYRNRTVQKFLDKIF